MSTLGDMFIQAIKKAKSQKQNSAPQTEPGLEPDEDEQDSEDEKKKKLLSYNND